MGNIFINYTFDKQQISKNTQGTQETRQEKKFKKWGIDVNREFSNEERQMSEKHLKTCSASLATKEMQIKTTLRIPLTHVGMAKIKKTNDSSCWQRYGLLNHIHCCSIKNSQR